MERELLLLGLLRRQDMHGYQLHDFIESYMTMCVDLKKATAYFLLDKMEQMGWITQNSTQVGNRPTRRVYALTPLGEENFQRLLRENLASYLPARFGSDIGLAFVGELPATEAITLLQQRRVTLAESLANAQAIPPHEGVLQWVIEHQVVHLTAELQWLDQVIGRLSENTHS